MNHTIPHTTLTVLLDFRQSMQQELKDILDYWMQYTPDRVNGGFTGKITHQNIIDQKAPKGSVLNSRILWAFSAAYNLTGNSAYQQMAVRAYEYFTAHFTDEEFGGIYWSVDYQGNPLDTKKQTYASAFGLYALAEYEKCSEDPEVMEEAKMLYMDIINNTSDTFKGGYYEAFARDWSELADMRLSAKDANEKKSMNTHLHVIEAFANLYTIWPHEKLRKKIEELLDLFSDHIINHKDHHLYLFFGEDWEAKAGTISYGHDIEAAWLLQECAVIIKDEKYIEQFKKLAVQMARSSAEGLDADGGLWYEFEPSANHIIKQKHSWPQAEAMVGFLNAWQVSGDEEFLQYSLNSWNFTKEYIKDRQGGEWVWGINEDYSVMNNEDKVGIWKCPYHNSRACIEIIKLINEILNDRT